MNNTQDVPAGIGYLDCRVRLRVLVACEYSGMVRDAFRALGHDAMSCDLEPSERPGPHHQGDVRPLLREPWDLVVAHPVCRYLTNAGALHLYEGRRRYNEDGSENRLDLDRIEAAVIGARLFRECLDANAPCVAVENPVMHDFARRLTWSPHPSQTVQPWWFGDETFKATTFRLRGLPPLEPTNKLTPPGKRENPEEHKRWSWVHRMPPGPTREKERSRMHPGMAKAMAEQWARACMET